jgi:(1->4)-alpha-D-glucan 1-alpha-D-glucosylmutase
MAKGLEDSALYRYVPLASMNEVDADPRGPSATSINEFHRWNVERLQSWPDTMSATSTHDTKRSEDVRARINVISEIPDEWSRAATQWRRKNAQRRRDGAPCPNEEWLLYQTLAGAWPLDQGEMAAFCERVQAYMIKAARESGERTLWRAPDETYERSFSTYIEALLQDERFLAEFRGLRQRVAWFGMLNSLSQVLLKVASPGVPDFYQGCELWDFSLVDPDNRRPVDFATRVHALQNLRDSDGQSALLEELRADWRNSRIKAYITWKVLTARQECADVFARGDYLRLYASGWARRHVVAFARRRRRRWAIAVAPRFLTKLAGEGEWPIGEGVWRTATLPLPLDAPSTWRNALTGDELHISGDGRTGALRISQIFAHLPVALLVT